MSDEEGVVGDVLARGVWHEAETKCWLDTEEEEEWGREWQDTKLDLLERCSITNAKFTHDTYLTNVIPFSYTLHFKTK